MSDWDVSEPAMGQWDWQIDILRARCWSLARENPYVKTFLQELGNNIFGGGGLKFQSRVKTPRGKPDEAANKAIEAAWMEAGKRENADANRRWTRDKQNKILLNHVILDGDAVLEFLPGYGNPAGFACSVVAGSRIPNQYSDTRDGATVESGIRKGVWG
ncbi:MAG TPA: phage portal protein, partial [Terrimicrobiaceae bacterium]|nr:phage portal protein [Terrimicrobiaceae bacterium]